MVTFPVFHSGLVIFPDREETSANIWISHDVSPETRKFNGNIEQLVTLKGASPWPYPGRFLEFSTPKGAQLDVQGASVHQGLLWIIKV
jgi:hypothetical protein